MKQIAIAEQEAARTLKEKEALAAQAEREQTRVEAEHKVLENRQTYDGAAVYFEVIRLRVEGQGSADGADRRTGAVHGAR